MEKLKAKIMSLYHYEHLPVSVLITLDEIELLIKKIVSMPDYCDKYKTYCHRVFMFAKEEMISSKITSYGIPSNALMDALCEIEDNT